MADFFQLDSFIAEHVIKRPESLFTGDLQAFGQRLYENIHGKSMLVIGGAGTIGSSFIKAALPYGPGKLVVVDINENGLTELVRDCRSAVGLTLPADFKSYPVNFSDKVFKKLFLAEGPFDIVANFSAHKHVRSEKDAFSIEAMVENNVLRAKEFLDLLLEYPPAHFFCVSTDKAANPVNIMGASKKLMEEVIMAYSTRLKITTARFANVAFSNGSLLAGFFERMLKKQPLSCPSDVRRFFVSPAESGQICLMACVLGDAGDIFFPRLDMDNDLTSFASIVEPFLRQFGYGMEVCGSEQEARQKAAGLRGENYPVYFFKSETSGEKLYEEFYTDEEAPVMDRFKSLGVIKVNNRKTIAEVEAVVDEIKALFDTGVAKEDIVVLLRKLLPGFHHIETGLNLDQKM
jgi:FlaA1/EpsC-like NDP-sugar epimerase